MKRMTLTRIYTAAALLTCAPLLTACTPSGAATPSVTPVSEMSLRQPANTTLNASGTVDGGGGKGVRCVKPDGTSTVQVLDLYESEVIRGENADTLAKNLSTEDQYVEYLARKIIPMLEVPSNPFSEAESRLEAHKAFQSEYTNRLRKSTKPLPLTPDATTPSLPPACSIVQIAIWQPNGKIAIDETLREKLDSRNEAALAAHEFVYKFTRSNGAVTSDEVRWVIGSAFSDKPLVRRFPQTMASHTIETGRCFGGGGEPPTDGPIFEIFAQEETENGASGLALYMGYTDTKVKGGGVAALTETRTFVPRMTLQQFESSQFPATLTFASNTFHAPGWKFENLAADQSRTDQPRYTDKVRVTQPNGKGGDSVMMCGRL